MNLKQLEAPTLCELFDIGDARVIAFVGAGGKTTTMFSLAHELAEQGFRVAVSTTTHIFCPDAHQCADVVTDDDPEKIAAALGKSRLVTVGTPCGDSKLSPPATEALHYLQANADYLLLESDGSRCLPIKVPGDYEPALYPETERLIAVGGLSCLGKPLERVCHRAQAAMALLHADAEHLLTTQDVAALLWRSYGQLGLPLIISLNQADNDYLRSQAGLIATHLLEMGAPRVAVTSFLSKQFACYTKLAPGKQKSTG